MSTPEAEIRNKEYQKQYREDRLARKRYSYESLENHYRVTAGGKDLSAELMAQRAPGVTGETPWVKDLTVHPLQWRREGIPAGLPIYIENAFEKEAPPGGRRRASAEAWRNLFLEQAPPSWPAAGVRGPFALEKAF